MGGLKMHPNRIATESISMYATELTRPFRYLSVVGEDAGEDAGELPTLPATRLAALAVAFAPCSTPRAVALAPRSIPLAAAFAPRATVLSTLPTTPGAVLVVDSAGSSEPALAWLSRMNIEVSATAVLRIVFMKALASLLSHQDTPQQFESA